VKRRLVLLTCLLGFVGASAGTALADNHDRKPRNEVCIVLAKDDAGNTTEDVCVNWPSIPQYGAAQR
jgi:hypothetical protein